MRGRYLGQVEGGYAVGGEVGGSRGLRGGVSEGRWFEVKEVQQKEGEV